MSAPSASPQRFGWVAAAPKKNLVVGMGEMLASNDTQATLVTYSLGSCVGVTIHDPVAKVGGMLHAMLPDSTINFDRAASRPFMFVDTGLPALFHSVYALGGVKQRLVVKLAGGAQFLDEKKIFNIGVRNSDAILAMLQRNGVLASACEIGGHSSRTLRLNLATGAVTLDMPGEPSRTL